MKQLPLQQVHQQSGHNQDQHDQRGRNQAELPASGSPVSTPAELLALPQCLFFLAEGTVFICIGVFLPTDGAAFHSHGKPPVFSVYNLHNIGFFPLRQDQGRRIYRKFALCRPLALLLLSNTPIIMSTK